jgi:hypothetical protein
VFVSLLVLQFPLRINVGVGVGVDVGVGVGVGVNVGVSVSVRVPLRRACAARNMLECDSADRTEQHKPTSFPVNASS